MPVIPQTLTERPPPEHSRTSNYELITALASTAFHPAAWPPHPRIAQSPLAIPPLLQNVPPYVNYDDQYNKTGLCKRF